MLSFNFVCYEPSMSFSSRLNLGGGIDEHSWDDGGDWPGHEIPSLGGRQLEWRIESERSIFDYYAYSLKCLDREMVVRSPIFEEHWREHARAMLWESEPGFMSLTIAAPADQSFVSFIATAVVAGMGLQVRLPSFGFATKETAPAPTVDAFLNRSEPAFFREAFFRPYRRVGQDTQSIGSGRKSRLFR